MPRKVVVGSASERYPNALCRATLARRGFTTTAALFVLGEVDASASSLVDALFQAL